jgi:hypothetical protein
LLNPKYLSTFAINALTAGVGIYAFSSSADEFGEPNVSMGKTRVPYLELEAFYPHGNPWEWVSVDHHYSILPKSKED